MDFTCPHPKAKHDRECHALKAEPLTAASTIPSFSSPLYNYDIYPTNIPLNDFQTFTTIAPEVPGSIPNYYSTEYFPELNPAFYPPYYNQFFDNCIQQPLVPPQYPTLQYKHQSPALFTPPPTPQAIDPHVQCRPISHTHTHPPSPAAVPQGAVTLPATGTVRGKAHALEPKMTEIESVSVNIDASRAWKDQFDNGYGDLVTAAAPFSPAQELASYAHTNFAHTVHATNPMATAEINSAINMPNNNSNNKVNNRLTPPSPTFTIPISIPPSPFAQQQHHHHHHYQQQQHPPFPSTTTTTTMSQKPNPPARTQRKTRARIRRICHKCETLFGGKTCLGCQHRLCDRCGEFELVKRGPVRWIGR